MREEEASISAVVVALDKEKDVTTAVRALRRLFPTVDASATHAVHSHAVR